MAVPFDSSPRGVQGLINDLYVRSFAGLAALSSAQKRVEDVVLGDVIGAYIDVSKTQVRRLHDVAAATDTDLATGSGADPTDELRDAARDLARGLLSGHVDSAAVIALERLATVKLELYREAGEWFDGNAGVKAVMHACEAEEAGFLDRLQYFHEAGNRPFDAANTLSFAF